MKRLILTLAVVAATVLASLGVADATITWGTAQPVTGFSALGASGGSVGQSVHCTTPGNCFSLGTYVLNNGTHAFKASETNGVWGAAEAIASLDALATNGSVDFEAFGCSPQNTCIAGGEYYINGDLEGFVYDVSSNTAIAIPGLTALNLGHIALVRGVSCSSPGNCSVIGTYRDIGSRELPFTADEVAGVWQNAAPVTGVTGDGHLESVSCWADGECMAVGDANSGAVDSPITVARTGGSWSSATFLPGVNAIGLPASTGTAISCSAGPVCVALGVGNGPGFVFAPFVTSFANGVWADAQILNGFSSLPSSNSVTVAGISCWTPTNCLTSGSMATTNSGVSTWVAELVNGAWAPAIEMPGITALNTGTAGVTTQSCASDGTCAVAGYYTSTPNVFEGFVFTRNTNGTFSSAQPIPGLSALNVGGYGDPKGLSCVVGGCSATGWYRPSVNNTAAFVLDMVATPDPAPTPDPVAPAFTG